MKAKLILLSLISLLVVGTVYAASDAKVAATPAAPTVTVPTSVTAEVPKAEEAKPAEVEKKAEEAKPAQETQKWWQGVLVTLLEGLVAILLPILSILGMALVRKFGLKIEQEKLDWILDKAVGYGEQKLKTLLKAGKPVDGPEIAKAALEHGNTLLKKYGLFSKFGDWLAEGIEAKLGQKVVEAGGAAAVVGEVKVEEKPKEEEKPA